MCWYIATIAQQLLVDHPDVSGDQELCLAFVLRALQYEQNVAQKSSQLPRCFLSDNQTGGLNLCVLHAQPARDFIVGGIEDIHDTQTTPR